MSFNIGSSSKYPNQATIWEIDDKGTFANVKISTSRKDKRLPEGKQWVNTNWFSKFVGDAYSKIDQLAPKVRIEIVSGTIAQESYMDKDGNKAWPKSAQVTIFDFLVLSKSEGGTSGFDKAPAVQDDSDVPF